MKIEWLALFGNGLVSTACDLVQPAEPSGFKCRAHRQKGGTPRKVGKESAERNRHLHQQRPDNRQGACEFLHQLCPASFLFAFFGSLACAPLNFGLPLLHEPAGVRILLALRIGGGGEKRPALSGKQGTAMITTRQGDESPAVTSDTRTVEKVEESGARRLSEM